MDLLFALKALAGVVGIATGMVIGSFISAIWLRLAAQWLRFAEIPYLKAFRCALISNFVASMLNFSIGVNSSLATAMLNQMSSGHSSVNMAFGLSPIYFMYVTIFGLFVSAVIFCRTIPDSSTDPRIGFGDSLALASLYYALGFAFMLILGLLAFCIVAAVLALLGS